MDTTIKPEVLTGDELEKERKEKEAQGMNFDSGKRYPIGHVCKQLNLLEHQLRYFEKCIGYEIERDEYNNRVYSDKDLHHLTKLLEYKTRDGMTYRQIKKKVEQEGILKYNVSVEEQEEVAVDEDMEKQIALISNDTAKAIIQVVIGQNQALMEHIKILEEKQLEKVELMEKQIEELKQQQNDNTERLLKAGEERDLSLVSKLTDAMERQRLEADKKKGFFSKMFK